MGGWLVRVILLNGGLCDWHRDNEPGARGSRFQGYLTIMIANNRLAHRKAHSRTLARRLGGEERVEDARLVLGGNSGASIFKGEDDA